MLIEFGAVAEPAAKILAQQLVRGVVTRRGRDRLRVGEDAPARRKALVAVVEDGVGDAAGDLFDDDEERESFRRALLDQDRAVWPLVNGTGPSDLVGEVRGWVAPLLAEVDEAGRVPTVRADHPYVETLVASVLGRLEHWALRSGGSPLTPMWQAFVAEAEAGGLFNARKVPPRLEELHEESLFDVLQFQYRVVPFVAGGRLERAVGALLAWARGGEGEPGVSVGVVSGPAGTGKSRLAAEVCDRLTEDSLEWQAGFADYTALASAPVPEVPTLLVCDYPERHPALVGDFLARLWQSHREGRLGVPVRVLLVSRHQGTWWEPVQTRARNLERLIGHRVDLTPGRLDAEELDRHAAIAFEAFCDGFGIPKVWRQDFRPDRTGADRPLLAHISALLAAHDLAHHDTAMTPDRVRQAPSRAEALLDDLIGAEVDRLARLRIDGEAAKPLVFGSTAAVWQALCVTTLTAPARCDLPELLACTEAFGPSGGENRAAVTEALLYAFPAVVEGQPTDRMLRRIGPVEPDLVAAHLLARTPGRSELVKRLVASETVAERPAYHAQLVGALALAAEDYAEVETDLRKHLTVSLTALIEVGGETTAPLATLLGERLIPLVKAAVAAAVDQDLRAIRHLATAVSLPGLADDHAIDRASSEALWMLPYPYPALAGLGAALAARAVVHHERDRDQPTLAAAYGQLGTWLGDHGQRPEALAASERAAGLYEELVEDNRAAYLPDLAMSVNNLANHLAEAGRRAEGLAAAERAAALYEELVEDNQAAYLPDLATSVNNLAIRLAEVGRRAEGLAAAERAVALREELAESNRAAYLPDLATSVNNLANRLAEAGRRAEGLAAAERAVALREELIEDNQAAYLPDLAMSVNNLANHLAEAGRRAEGLAAAERATGLYEELAESNRDAYLPALATSVNNLAIDLAEAGRRAEGLAAAERAVALREELAESNRAAYLPDLAMSVNNLANRLAEAGRRAEGLAAAERAVALREELAESNRDAYLPDLAMSVNNLANHLAEAGRRAEGLAAAERATGLYEELVEGNRDAYLPDLAMSLWTAASVRSVLDTDLAGALVFCDRSIEYYRELAASESAVFEGDLAAVEDLRRDLADRAETA